MRDYERGAQWCPQVADFSGRMGARFLLGVCRAHYGALRGWHGRFEEAERELVAALDDLTSNRPSWRCEALVRLGELRRQQERLEEAAALFDQAPDHPLARRGPAALSLDHGEPAVARDLLERALRRLPPASGASRADGFLGSGAPLEAAHVRIELAHVLLALGRVGTARREAHVARAGLEDLGAAGEMARADDLLSPSSPHAAPSMPSTTAR